MLLLMSMFFCALATQETKVWISPQGGDCTANPDVLVSSASPTVPCTASTCQTLPNTTSPTIQMSIVCNTVSDPPALSGSYIHLAEYRGLTCQDAVWSESVRVCFLASLFFLLLFFLFVCCRVISFQTCACQFVSRSCLFLKKSANLCRVILHRVKSHPQTEASEWFVRIAAVLN